MNEIDHKELYPIYAQAMRDGTTGELFEFATDLKFRYAVSKACSLNGVDFNLIPRPFRTHSVTYKQLSASITWNCS